MGFQHWGAFSTLMIASTVSAQSNVPIKGTQNVHLSASVEHAIQVDGIKDRMRCDAAHNIYVPANRGYSSAWGSVVEIMAGGKQFHNFSLDGVPNLETGHVEDFEVAKNGSVYVLAREVRKYSDVQVPVEFGSTYILRFSPSGKLEGQTKLKTDFGDERPSGLAVLRGENFLVTSYSYTSDKKVRMFVNIFLSGGSLKGKVPLSANGTQASNAGSVASMSVIRPMTVMSAGLIFVLRGSTRDPMYVFSDNGELIRTVRLQATDVEFTSPKVLGNQLVVHQVRVHRPSGSVLTVPDLNVFPVFDLDSGALVKQFEWRQRGELACYDGNTLTFMQQGLDWPAKNYYAVIDAQPTSTTEPPHRHPSGTPIKLELRWIVSCTDETPSVPLRGDEAASRYCLSETLIVDQNDVDSASTYLDGLNRPGLKLVFTPGGAEKLHEATIAGKDAELGFVIDGDLVLKTIVVQPVGREAAISGAGLDKDELLDWVTRLNAEAEKRAKRKSARTRIPPTSVENSSQNALSR